jgi:hypothetical protein
MDLTVERVLAQPRVKRLLSTEDFSIHGTQLEARAWMEELHAWPDESPAGAGATGRQIFTGRGA